MKQKYAKRIAETFNRVCTSEILKEEKEYNVYLRFNWIPDFNKTLQLLRGEGVYVTIDDLYDNCDYPIIATVEYDGSLGNRDLLTIKISCPEIGYTEDDEMKEIINCLEARIEQTVF